MHPAYVNDVAAFADKTRYQMTLSLTDAPLHIDGRQRVIFVNSTGVELEEVVFRLYPNLNSYGGEMAVSRVTLNEQTVNTPQLDATRSILTVPRRRQTSSAE